MCELEAPVLSVYDPRWADRFAAFAARARAALGSLVARVEHVGSTAVERLDALPIVDLDVVLALHQDLAPAIDRLAALGYQHEGDLGIAGREAFRSPAGEVRHHLYLLVEGADELARHVRFRDALRAQPQLRNDYAALKRSLAARHPGDREAYKHGKTGFIEAALVRAGAAR